MLSLLKIKRQYIYMLVGFATVFLFSFRNGVYINKCSTKQLATPNDTTNEAKNYTAESKTQKYEKIITEQAYRQKLYSDICSSHGKAYLGIDKSAKVRPRSMFVVDSHRLLYCRLPKVGCTNWKIIISHLNSNISFDDMLKVSPDDIHKSYHHLYMKELLSATFTDEDVNFRLKHYYKFVFIRHPFDRLLSAYEDKFNRVMPPGAAKFEFIDEYINYIIKLCRSGYNAAQNETLHVTFEEFLCYVSEGQSSMLNRHWSPYWMNCNFCENNWNYNFIGKYESLSEETDYLFDLWGLRYIRFPPALHSREEQRQRFKQAYASVSPAIVDAVYRRYSLDFLLFGYDKFPDWYFK